METDNRNQGPFVRRIRPARVTPLELWDLCIGDGILWDWSPRKDFGIILRAMLYLLHSGGGETRSGGPVPACIAGFTGVYLTGGGAASLAPHFRSPPWPVWIAEDGSNAAEPGGFALLAEHGSSGAVVDLGQSALKVFASGLRWTFARNYAVLPVREDRISRVPIASQREALRAFIANSLRTCVRDGMPEPRTILCALPSRLDSDGVPEGSSYIGMRGDVSLVPDALALAGICPQNLLLLNDAELAAVSARLDRRVRSRVGGRILVLTIGFGVGAALLET